MRPELKESRVVEDVVNQIVCMSTYLLRLCRQGPPNLVGGHGRIQLRPLRRHHGPLGVKEGVPNGSTQRLPQDLGKRNRSGEWRPVGVGGPKPPGRTGKTPACCTVVVPSWHHAAFGAETSEKTTDQTYFRSTPHPERGTVCVEALLHSRSLNSSLFLSNVQAPSTECVCAWSLSFSGE